MGQCRWLIPDMHHAPHTVLLMITMSHRCHFTIISVPMICLFLQRPSIWPKDSDAFPPPRCLSHLSTHSLGFTFLIKKKCQRLFGKFHTVQPYFSWLLPPHYNSENICRSTAEHQIVWEEAFCTLKLTSEIVWTIFCLLTPHEHVCKFN